MEPEDPQELKVIASDYRSDSGAGYKTWVFYKSSMRF